ncbi:MAG: ATP-binding protein [Elusimicrobia bacterium]|nr:ATP-binding protein [Elusimicrobiota bacterium]
MTRTAAPRSAESLQPEVVQILGDFNPWWQSNRPRREVPPFRRRGVPELLARLAQPKGLIEIIRGPRQVGKTTAISQAIEHILARGAKPSDILFVRFDQEVLRESRGGLIPIIRWFGETIRKRPLDQGEPAYIFLDEIHKLDRWDEDVKFLSDTFKVRLVLTGSSSVLVARGGRESLAGRAFTTEMPTFQFREVLEAWEPGSVVRLPPSTPFRDLIGADPNKLFGPLQSLRPQQVHSLRRHLDRYYNRGGYPRLYNGEVGEDQWADYLTQTIIDRVLGVDVPDLFPVHNPKLLRWIYVEIARATGQEVVQYRLAEWANQAGFRTSQPHVGRYMHYLSDALLIREFKRYPLVKRTSARAPSKITLTDLGARNALFRGAPSLWESSPDHVGSLVETLAQSVIRGPNLQIHFFRDFENPKDRRTPVREVDFVVEDLTGIVVPIEIKFRRQIEPADLAGLKLFMTRHKAEFGLLVTRDTQAWYDKERILAVPLLTFLLAF